MRITELPELVAPAEEDFVAVVDVDDTTESPEGTTKKVAVGSLPGGGAAPAGTDGDTQVKNASALAAGYSRHASNLIQDSKPRVGNGTPYASEGRATQAMADADQTLAASVYSRKTIQTTGTLTADRTATMPHPGSEDASYEKDWQNDCTGKDVIISTGTGTTVRLSQGARVRLKFSPSGVEIATFSLAGIEVNVMDYYVSTDGAPSLGTMGPGGTAITTKNLALAFERAWNAKIATRRARGIYFPPCVEYGVQAYSFKEPKTYALDHANGRLNVYLRFSGDASIIVPDSSAAVDTKLLFASGGPAGMTTLFRVEGLSLCGVDTVTNDCATFISTTVDMEVTYEDCTLYSVQSNHVYGVLRGSGMGVTFRRCNFHWCCNSAADGAVISVQTGTFGALFEHCNWYSWEKNVNPFGGTNYDKSANAPNYHVALHGGGQPYTQTRAKFLHCTSAESNGRWGFILAKPDATLRIDTIHLDQCHIYASSRRLIEARNDVGHIIIENTRVEHNDSGDASVHLQAASCERLTMRGVWLGPTLKVTAATGQKSVIVEECTGGVYNVSGADHVVKRASTLNTFTSTSGVTQDLVDVENSLTLAVGGVPVCSTAGTTSAQVAALVTDETGTGSLVFANAPTLTDPTVSGVLTVGPVTIFDDGRVFAQSALASEIGSSPVDSGTTDATPTPIDTYAVPPPITRLVTVITWTVIANFAGPEVAAYQVTAVYSHDGAALSLVGTPTKTVLGESAGATALDVTADANAGNARLIATGIAATNISWSSTRKVLLGGS